MEKNEVAASIRKRMALVLEVRELTESAYVLRLDKGQMTFTPGQYVVLGFPGTREKREYSVYSPVYESFIEVLIKEVDTGSVSKKLKRTKPGDVIEVEGPFGYFVINEARVAGNKFLFIASGTGISPFHSLVLSYPAMDYTILHGVRYGYEAYEKDCYHLGRYIQCTSREKTGEFFGRVTEYLRKNPVNPLTLCYLCGNSSMVDEAYRILEDQGLPPAHLHAEIYF